MKIISINVFVQQKDGTYLIAEAQDFSMLWFFQRKMAKQHLHFTTRMIASKVTPGARTATSVSEVQGIVYCWTTIEGISVTIMADKDYPEKVAFFLANAVVNDLRMKIDEQQYLYVAKDTDVGYNDELKVLFQNYQNPAKSDKLYAIQEELKEVKEIMHQNFKDLLDRGESIESLMAKSHDISATSLNYYKSAKKANARCCKVG